MDIASLERINWDLATSLNRLRDRVDWMAFGQEACEPAGGITGVVGAVRSIPIVRDALEKAFFKTSGPERISEDTYDAIKREIDETEDYVKSYPRMVDYDCNCKVVRHRQ